MPRIILLLVCLAASNAHAQWSFDNAVPLGFAQGPVSKNLAVDQDFNVHTAFRSGSNVLYHYKQSSNGEWLMAESVTDSASMGTLGDIAIALNPLTMLPVVVFQSNERIWFAERQNGGVWTRTLLGDSTEAAYSPDVAVNLDGHIYVVYIVDRTNGYQLGCAYFDGFVWQFDYIDTDIGDFGLGAAPRVAMDGNSAAHIVFRGGNFGSYAARHATNEFGGGTEWVVSTLAVPHAESYPGDIAVDEFDGVHCVSSGSDGFGIPGPVYYHHQSPGGTWSFGVPVTGGESAGNPVIALDSHGDPHVFALGINGNIYTEMLIYSSSVTGWFPETIYGHSSGTPALVIDPLDYGIALVPSTEWGGSIFYLKSTESLVPQTWVPEISIEPGTLVFDTVFVGRDSTLEIRLTNPSEVVLNISGFDLNSPVFHGPDEWHPVPLMWGWSTGLVIRFEPTANQLYSGFVVITSNAISSPDTVFLTGRGVILDDAAVAPLSNEFALHPLYPNPFNGGVNVEFELARDADVSLDVFDVLGRRVETLVSGRMDAGSHVLQWQGGERAAGVYLFRLNTGSGTFVQKAAYLK